MAMLATTLKLHTLWKSEEMSRIAGGNWRGGVGESADRMRRALIGSSFAYAIGDEDASDREIFKDMTGIAEGAERDGYGFIRGSICENPCCSDHLRKRLATALETLRENGRPSVVVSDPVPTAVGACLAANKTYDGSCIEEICRRSEALAVQWCELLSDLGYLSELSENGKTPCVIYTNLPGFPYPGTDAASLYDGCEGEAENASGKPARLDMDGDGFGYVIDDDTSLSIAALIHKQTAAASGEIAPETYPVLATFVDADGGMRLLEDAIEERFPGWSTAAAASSCDGVELVATEGRRLVQEEDVAAVLTVNMRYTSPSLYALKTQPGGIAIGRLLPEAGGRKRPAVRGAIALFLRNGIRQSVSHTFLPCPDEVEAQSGKSDDMLACAVETLSFGTVDAKPLLSALASDASGAACVMRSRFNSYDDANTCTERIASSYARGRLVIAPRAYAADGTDNGVCALVKRSEELLEFCEDAARLWMQAQHECGVAVDLSPKPSYIDEKAYANYMRYGGFIGADVHVKALAAGVPKEDVAPELFGRKK